LSFRANHLSDCLRLSLMSFALCLADLLSMIVILREKLMRRFLFQDEFFAENRHNHNVIFFFHNLVDLILQQRKDAWNVDNPASRKTMFICEPIKHWWARDIQRYCAY
jgi:hypothetical protein